MSIPAIQAVGLSKKYRIRKSRGPSYQTLREQMTVAMAAPWHKFRQLVTRQAKASEPAHEDFWAVKDVSFEIRSGEVMGIIGQNGAGKSTLLKLLSRITEPSDGYADIRGRIGSLLEVGTGFHPELTGRENIFLNGVILGMRQSEVRKKFDEIVAFAEVDRFVDTPVKHYSSGMYMRLAFAVAAHLEPEILLVDEVLAVGDSRFQKKCLSKMAEVGRAGRTVLFVSHSMPAITRLCQRAIMIERGRLVHDGPADEVVAAYLHGDHGTSAKRVWENPAEAPQGECTRLRAVRVRNAEGEVSESMDIRRPVALEMEFEVLESGYFLLPHFHLFNDQSIHVFTAHDLDPEWRGRRRPKGRYTSVAWIPGNFLAEGMFFVHANMLSMDPPRPQFVSPDSVAFHVVDSQDGDSARGDWVGKMYGVVRPALRWETRYESAASATDEEFAEAENRA
ncbi:MAG: polysaccharide ABC transporter ATP-binding protein [Pirellulaceae bacterium]